MTSELRTRLLKALECPHEKLSKDCILCNYWLSRNPIDLALADVVEALSKMSASHTPVCSSVRCHEKCLAALRKTTLAKLDEILKETEMQ